MENPLILRSKMPKYIMGLKKVQAIVIAQDPAELLLMQTNKSRGAFWQNITGHVEKNENLKDACLREFFEETGLGRDDLIEVMDLNYLIEFSSRGHEYKEYCFLIIIKEVKNIQIDAKEHQSYQFLPISKISGENFKFTSNFEAFQVAYEKFTHFIN
jgi:dATP pyrophosphohydrolase